MNKELEKENLIEKRFTEIQKQLRVRYVVKDALHCRKCDNLTYLGELKRDNLDQIENAMKEHLKIHEQ